MSILPVPQPLAGAFPGRGRIAAARLMLIAIALLLGSCGGGGGGGDGGGGGAATTAPSGPSTASKSCPLTDEQTQNSVAAWGKIADFLTGEPRCVNCHGAVNPYIDGVGVDSTVDTDGTPVPVSQVEHEGGQIDRPKSDGTIHSELCVDCHDAMVRPTPNTPAIWTLPLASHSFVNKDATTLCKQIKGATNTADVFMSHMEDDEGLTDFVDTAFLGNRAIGSFSPEEYKPPSIPKAQFLQMGRAWIDAMGGRFQGDVSCGCEAKHSGWSGQIHSAQQTDVKRPRATGVATGRSVATVIVTVADGKGKYRGDFTLHYQDPEASWDGAPITESTEGSGDGIVPVELAVDLTGGVGGSYTVSLAYPSEQIDQKIIGTQADTYCSTRYGTCNTTI